MFALFPATIFVLFGGAQIWRPHSEPYKFLLQILKKNSAAENCTDARLGQFVNLSIFYNIRKILGFRHSKVFISVFDGLIVKTTNNLHLLPLRWQNRKKWSVQAKALKVYHRDQYKVSTLNILEMLFKFSFVLFQVPLLQPAYGGTSTLFLVFRVHVVF